MASNSETVGARRTYAERPNAEVSDAATHGVQIKPSERGGVREH